MRKIRLSPSMHDKAVSLGSVLIVVAILPSIPVALFGEVSLFSPFYFTMAGILLLGIVLRFPPTEVISQQERDP